MVPRLLLLPEVTEIQWTIRSRLESWAEVRSFDPPGIGGQPGSPAVETPAQRALEELDDAGWERCVILADGWAVPLAVRVARAWPGRVAAMALGHASLSSRRDGERAPISPTVYDAVTQLIRNDAPTFLRHGVVQLTGGSTDEALAQQIIERVPRERLSACWEAMTEPETYGDALDELGIPLLLATHRGCVMHTEEGFEDAVERLAHVRAIAVDHAPCADPEFADAVRDLCDQVW